MTSLRTFFSAVSLAAGESGVDILLDKILYDCGWVMCNSNVVVGLYFTRIVGGSCPTVDEKCKRKVEAWPLIILAVAKRDAR